MKGIFLQNNGVGTMSKAVSETISIYWIKNYWSWAGRQQLMHIILATQEAEIRRIAVQSQPGQIVHETLSWKNPTKKGWWSGSSGTCTCVASMRPWVQTEKKKLLKLGIKYIAIYYIFLHTLANVWNCPWIQKLKRLPHILDGISKWEFKKHLSNWNALMCI
jgi:hypothetical protein